MGGSLIADHTSSIAGKPAAVWVAETLAQLTAMPRVTLLPRTTAFGYYPHNLLGLVERVTDHLATPDPGQPRERLWQVRAKEVVLASGAIERPLTFPDNDRPGIMLADAAHAYVTRYGAIPGGRAVLATANDSGYRAALALHEAGVEIAAVADLRQSAEWRLAGCGASGRAAGRDRRHGYGHDGANAACVRFAGEGRWRGRRRGHARDWLRPAADGGRLDALGASLLAVPRQASLRRDVAGLCSRRGAAADSVRGSRRRHLRPWERARQRFQRRRGSGWR